MSPVWTILASVLVSSAGVSLAAFLTRRKTSAEVSRTDAETADLVSQGAMRLVPYYEARLAAQQADINDLKQRVAKAETSEARCLVRLEALQTQLDELRAAISKPPPTVTVTTTQVTESNQHEEAKQP